LYACKMLTDSHTHLYLDAFDKDREDMVDRALDAGVTRMLLPNIDPSTTGPMLKLCDRYPENCQPMAGLHPTSVKENFMSSLEELEGLLDDPRIVGIGETGIDLYWDKTFIREQEESFRIQIRWARELGLPLVIHARESFREIFRIMDQEETDGLRGVFHSFTGGHEEMEKALSYGFMLGINGIVTFKNAGLAEVVRDIPLARLLLETDAPFLAPVPRRGKRNESSYLVHIADRVAEIHHMDVEKLAGITTENAASVFKKTGQHGQ